MTTALRKKVPGRPPKVTAEITQTVANAIAAGNYQRTAMQLAGISESAFYQWLEWGREGREPYKEFAEAIEKAQAQAEARNVAIIETAARETWQAAAWWLERRYPDRWGRREHHEHSGAIGLYDAREDLTKKLAEHAS
jgi:hypothetical protein